MLILYRLKEKVKHIELLLSQSEDSFEKLERDLVHLTKVRVQDQHDSFFTVTDLGGVSGCCGALIITTSD